MSGSRPLNPPRPPQGSGAPHPGPTSAQRPRGFDDLALGIVEYSLAALLGFALLLVPLLGVLSGPTETADAVETSVFSLFVLTLGFQVLQGSYPWVYSRRRGRTIEQDWRFVSRLPNDIFVGLALAIACIVGSQASTLGMAALVGLEDTDSASNTGILVDNQGSPWLIGIILLIVVGAPLSEELLFRGLILRKLQGWFGSAVAIIVSSLLFALPHWQPDATWQETAVLLAALAVVGLVFAIGAVMTGRLGPSVIAHFLFNAMGTIVTLWF